MGRLTTLNILIFCLDNGEHLIRLVNFAELHRPRTEVYVVVPEGDALLYKIVLTTWFGLATIQLRKGEFNDDAASVIFNFDEAGKIFIHGLAELLGIGCGHRLFVALGYRSIKQVHAFYGADDGDAVLAFGRAIKVTFH